MREFYAAAAAAAAALASLPAPALEALVIVQRSALAGFRHYAGPQAWGGIAVGDQLELVREPANPYDPNAVAVEWRGLRLGYVPRRDNAALARQIDRGQPLAARIARLGRYRNGRPRVEFEVVVALEPAAGRAAPRHGKEKP